MTEEDFKKLIAYLDRRHHAFRDALCEELERVAGVALERPQVTVKAYPGGEVRVEWTGMRVRVE